MSLVEITPHFQTSLVPLSAPSTITVLASLSYESIHEFRCDLGRIVVNPVSAKFTESDSYQKLTTLYTTHRLALLTFYETTGELLTLQVTQELLSTRKTSFLNMCFLAHAPSYVKLRPLIIVTDEGFEPTSENYILFRSGQERGAPITSFNQDQLKAALAAYNEYLKSVAGYVASESSAPVVVRQESGSSSSSESGSPARVSSGSPARSPALNARGAPEGGCAVM